MQPIGASASKLCGYASVGGCDERSLCSSGHNRGNALLFGRTEPIFTIQPGTYRCVRCLPRGPLYADLYGTARTKTRHAPRRPCIRKRWQQVDAAVVTLHQHFGNRCCCAEIAVDLKNWSWFGWMRIEQIYVRAVLHQH